VAETIKTLRIKDITVDPAIQPRAAGLDPDTVEEYAAAMTAGQEFPAGRVFKSAAGSLWLSRGFHRVAAAEQAGITRLDFEVVPGERKDAVIDAACSNTSHGLKRSNADKRKAVEILLTECPEWSDRKVADAAGVGHPLVAETRGQLEDSSSSPPPAARVGKDGKARAVKPRKPRKPKETKSEPAGRGGDTTGEDSPPADAGSVGAAPAGAPAPAPPADPAAEFVARINKLCHSLDGLKKEAAEVAATPVYGRQVHGESVTLQIEAARKALWQARPTEPCNCTAGGKPARPECRACFGAGVCPASRVLKGGR